MKKLLLIVVASCLLFTDCASSVKIMSGYEHVDVSKSNVGIILPFKTIYIENTSDVLQYLGGFNASDAYRQFFAHEFTKVLKKRSKFKNVTFVNDDENYHLRDTLIRQKYPRIYPTAFRGTTDSLQYLLIFSGLVVGREKAKKFKIGFEARSAFCGMGSNEINDAFDKLYHSGAFLLWDNVQGRIVSYGRFKTDQPIIFKMTKNNWNDIMYDVAYAIMSGTPYGK